MKVPPSTPNLIWIEKIAEFLDSKFTIPGTKIKFGIDPIIGLIPVAGDLSTMLLSSALLYTTAKHGASRKVLILMMINILLDTIIGSIPIVGSIFDFAYKSNQKNVRLLKEYYSEGKHQGSGNGILIIIIVATFILFGLLLFGLYKLIYYIYIWLSNL